MSLRGSSSKIMPKKQQRAVDRGMIPCLATFYGTASLLKTWKMVGTHILANDRQAGWLSARAQHKPLHSSQGFGPGGVDGHQERRARRSPLPSWPGGGAVA